MKIIKNSIEKKGSINTYNIQTVYKYKTHFLWQKKFLKKFFKNKIIKQKNFFKSNNLLFCTKHKENYFLQKQLHLE